MINIAINGFGRIGRTILRYYLQHLKQFNEQSIYITAINDIAASNKISYLFKFDTVYGPLPVEIKVINDYLITPDVKIKLTHYSDINQIPWKQLNINIVLESSGKYTNAVDSKQHIINGADKVIITAPAKNEDITLIEGINDNEYIPSKHNIISASSCTTNSIVPVVKVINDNFTIEKGYLTTTHAYTNDQRLVDSQHKDLRRGRSAATNIIPTHTGAAKSISLFFPQLNNKFDGIAMRVPVQVGSISNLSVLIKEITTKDKINNLFKEASKTYLRDILEYNDEQIVSSDIISHTHSTIFDSTLTLVNKNLLYLFSWYDNEYGYTSRVMALIKFISKKL